jgi:hypothetical protein
MKTLFLVFVCALFLPVTALHSQNCADVNGDAHLNVVDAVYMLNEHSGGPAIPQGKGDVDNKQGYTVGDARCIMNYIFAGGNLPTCPPHPTYFLKFTNDTIFLPSAVVPTGSGQLHLVIAMSNHYNVGDMVLPLAIGGMDAGIVFDSVQFSSLIKTGIVSPNWVSGTNTVITFYTMGNVIPPGLNIIGVVHFHYSSSAGGVLSLDTTTLSPTTFLNYTYGNIWSFDGSGVDIGIPKVVSVTNPNFPSLSVNKDTLVFQTLAGYPNPAPKSFTVLSDGTPFSWTLTKPSWITVSATSGISGQSVDVTPEISGLAIGTHIDNIMIFSTEALGSPKFVTVKLILKQQFPSLDANCDGIFNITDVVVQINYIFGSGMTPCNPCTGQPIDK